MWVINTAVVCHYFPPGLQVPLQPLKGLLPISLLGEQRHGVNSLPKTVTRQRRDCDLTPGPSAPESSTLTTRLPSHPGDDQTHSDIVTATHKKERAWTEPRTLLSVSSDGASTHNILISSTRADFPAPPPASAEATSSPRHTVRKSPTETAPRKPARFSPRGVALCFTR